jgi:hypothetical protein
MIQMLAVWLKVDKLLIYNELFVNFSIKNKSKGPHSMKIIVRAFVVALALTGAAASTQISSASATSKVTIAKNSAMPTPMCPPNDPNACGMAQGR